MREAVCLGIIPAGAGHLGWVETGYRWSRDHPRRCGAFDSWLNLEAWEKGSSPQVRGIYQVDQSDIAAWRIIPAGAGHFLPGTYAPGRRRDHPRRCGAFIT